MVKMGCGLISAGYRLVNQAGRKGTGAVFPSAAAQGELSSAGGGGHMLLAIVTIVAIGNDIWAIWYFHCSSVVSAPEFVVRR
jgi:hypothetical protein